MRITRPILAISSVLALGLAACGTSTDPADETANDTTAEAPAETGAEQTPSTEASSDSSDGDGASTDGGGTDDYSDVPKGDGSQTIYLVSKGFQHRFWQAVKEGAEQAGQDFNYKIEFVGPDSETQVTQQLDMLQTALNSKPAAIGLAALDTGAAGQLLDQIKEADIPLIAFDSGVDSDQPLTTVATDNFAAAEEAAKHMIELTGGEGVVGTVCHDQTSQTGKQRCDGFRSYIEENAPGIELLPVQYAGEVGLAADTTASLIQSNPDIVGLYGSNEAAASGVVQGASESGRDDLQLVGFDSGKIQMDAIRAGDLAGAITQAPVLMGYETVVAAIRAINGEELPETIDSGFAWYDANNIDSDEIKPNLYE